uniref:Uncharacterized protein n=1 Tax=Kalanchoe fedtschenkoi TaxID=63787 RepID=A0A7N0RGK4_KALFE
MRLAATYKARLVRLHYNYSDGGTKRRRSTTFTSIHSTLYRTIILAVVNSQMHIYFHLFIYLQVNKPYLPLASGEYSNRTGVLIVTSFAIMSFALGWIVGSWPLFWALFISFLLGTAYSINLPMLRWKRSALVAAMCILAVRAVIVQLAFYLHVQVPIFLSRFGIYGNTGSDKIKDRSHRLF